MGAVLVVMGIAGTGIVVSVFFARYLDSDAAVGWFVAFVAALLLSSFVFGLLWLGRTRCDTFGAVNGVETFWSASTQCLAETSGGLMLPPDQWYQLEGLNDDPS